MMLIPVYSSSVKPVISSAGCLIRKAAVSAAGAVGPRAVGPCGVKVEPLPDGQGFARMASRRRGRGRRRAKQQPEADLDAARHNQNGRRQAGSVVVEGACISRRGATCKPLLQLSETAAHPFARAVHGVEYRGEEAYSEAAW